MVPHSSFDTRPFGAHSGRTVVLVTAPGNPAMPFYFMFTPEKNAYWLWGEGTGRKEATSAAFEELRMLSQKEIVDLIEQTAKR